MGEVISAVASLFGAANYDEPDTPDYKPLPAEEEKEPVSRAIRNAEQNKLRRRQLMSGTILTSPLGTTGGGQTLLGG